MALHDLGYFISLFFSMVPSEVFLLKSALKVAGYHVNLFLILILAYYPVCV